MFKRTWMVMIVALALGLLFSACGSGDLAKDLTPIPTLQQPDQTPTLIEKLQGSAEMPAPEAPAPADAGPQDTGAGLDPELVAAGEQIFGEKCSFCHQQEDGTGPALPDMKQRGIDESAEDQTPEEYLHESIIDPNAAKAVGFEDAVMPPFEGQFSGEELDSLVAYILSQAKE